MDESILTSIKQMVGVEESDESFDIDIITYINTALALLHRIGAGPTEGLMITDDTTTWGEFTQNQIVLSLAKTYVYQKVRLEFDSASLTSAAIEAMKRSNAELEWSINIAVD